MSTVLLNKYETVVVTRTDAGHEAQKRLYDKVAELIEKAEGRHIRFELWGKRRLAYEIDKATKGLYTMYVFLAGPTFIKELQRQLKLSNIVLRYLTVKVGDDLNPETYDYEKEKQFDALPSDTDDSHDHNRSNTGWDQEFSKGDWAARKGDDDDEDEDDDDREDQKDLDDDDEE